MAKIRVLRVITWLPAGGIERKIVEVLPRLDPNRFDVSLVCLREPGPLAGALERAGIAVDCIPFARRWDPVALGRLAGLMRRRRIDVVHSHMYRSNVPAAVAARIAGVAHVWAQVHNVNTWETARQRAVDRFLCRWREGIIAVSENVRRDVIDQLRVSPEKVRLLYNGVDLQRFGSGEGREAIRMELGADPEDVVFLMAGRMVEQKRPGDFLELARYFLAKEREPGDGKATRFWFLGDGPKLEDLRRAAESLPMSESLRFLGRRDDVERVMAGADVFVMCSVKEGFSNALLEAMASGLAIIATGVGGNAEALGEGEAGLIVPPLDPSALRRAAGRIVPDSALRRTLSEKAKHRVKAFSLETMVRSVEDLYEESAGDRGRVRGGAR